MKAPKAEGRRAFEIRNPKPRNPKEIRNPKSEIRNPHPVPHAVRWLRGTESPVASVGGPDRAPSRRAAGRSEGGVAIILTQVSHRPRDPSRGPGFRDRGPVAVRTLEFRANARTRCDPGLRISDFGFPSDFGLRISDFLPGFGFRVS